MNEKNAVNRSDSEIVPEIAGASYDCEALIDVVNYLLDRRRRRLAAAESERAD